MTIAGLTFTVNQSNVNCTYSLSPTSASYATGGGSGSVDVTAQSGCIWKAISNDDWITVTSGANGSGNGTFNYSVEPNGGGARVGTITVEDQTFTVNQSGGCSFSISPGTALYSQTGGEGSVNVSTSVGCNWTAVSNAPWINISSGDAGSGNDIVNYVVRDNRTGSPRQGTMTIAGNTFTVVQGTSGGVPCNFSLSPTFQTFSASGGSGNITITVPANCVWRAASNVSWITITSVDIGIGNGSVTFSVATNPGPGGRDGSIDIGNRSFKVKQQ
jgi:hypothetical protein